jgi:hypothetical protein
MAQEAAQLPARLAVSAVVPGHSVLPKVMLAVAEAVAAALEPTALLVLSLAARTRLTAVTAALAMQLTEFVAVVAEEPV